MQGGQLTRELTLPGNGHRFRGNVWRGSHLAERIAGYNFAPGGNYGRFISTLPGCGPMNVAIPFPDSRGCGALPDGFFENRHMLMRDDFMKIIAKRQVPSKFQQRAATYSCVASAPSPKNVSHSL
jgi:hypothetical protein